MRDEQYIIDLCNGVLNKQAKRQYRFDFLKGDKAKRKNGKIVMVLREQGVKLPVDAYYEELNLVIEFLEIQHFKPVKQFDKPDKITVSGETRDRQRARYDERRRLKLPQNGFRLIEFYYTHFHHRNTGKLIRDAERDESIIRDKLSEFLEQ